MSIHDRDWYRDALRERARAADAADRRRRRGSRVGFAGPSRGPEPFWVVVAIWLVVFLVLFGIFRAATGR